MMAKRPWVIPADVVSYTDIQNVKNRSADKLTTDIARAEQYVIHYTNNRFDEEVQYPAIPEEVKTAVILIAERYAYQATEGGREVKSESFDDYSYTISDANMPTLQTLDLAQLLEEHIIAKQRKGVIMKLRRL